MLKEVLQAKGIDTRWKLGFKSRNEERAQEMINVGENIKF